MCCHGGSGGDGGGDHGRDDLPAEIRGHQSMKDLTGHVMDLGLYFRESDGPIILEAKHYFFNNLLAHYVMWNSFPQHISIVY